MVRHIQSFSDAFSEALAQKENKIRAVRIVSEQIVDLVEQLESPKLNDQERVQAFVRLKALCAMLEPTRAVGPAYTAPRAVRSETLF